jgi:hypothetical protein
VYKSSDNGVTWVELNRPTDWDFDSTGTIARLKAPVAPDYVMVRRITPYQELYTKFQDSSLLTADQLNEGEKFSMYVDQELFDLGDQGFWSKSDQVVDKPAQLLGSWPKDGKDKFIATTDAISARLDPYVQDGTPTPYGLPQKEQNGRQWFDTDELVQRFWDADAGAWVTLANTGPQGPPGPNVYFGTTFPAEPTSYGLWYDTNRKELRVRYNDGTGVQWVLAGGSTTLTGQLVAGNGVAANTSNQIQSIDQGVI